jgi:hypothetical protein
LLLNLTNHVRTLAAALEGDCPDDHDVVDGGKSSSADEGGQPRRSTARIYIYIYMAARKTAKPMGTWERREDGDVRVARALRLAYVGGGEDGVGEDEGADRRSRSAPRPSPFLVYPRG